MNPTLSANWDRIALSWPEYVDLREATATLEEVALDGERQAVLTGDAAEQLTGHVAESAA